LIASQKGHTEVVRLLLTAGADVNTMIKVDGIDYTPLSIAKKMSHTRIVKLLEEYGAKD
jgi:ankyrin repeat protein